MRTGCRRGWRPISVFAAAIAIAVAVLGPTARAARPEPAPELSEQEIITRFTQAESRLREARNNYTFTQDVLLQQMSGNVATGMFRRVSDILFDDNSKRIEKITYYPQPTLTSLTVTPEDLADLGVIQPFALTAEDLPKYTVKMVGREKIDDIDTYAFDIAPKDPEGMAKRGERYLTGRVWVENQDYMIVKVAGKAGPETKNSRFPHFETYREQIDENWFPTYTYADDVLSFENQDVHIRLVVKYTNYKRFGGNITVLPG